MVVEEWMLRYPTNPENPLKLKSAHPVRVHNPLSLKRPFLGVLMRTRQGDVFNPEL